MNSDFDVIVVGGGSAGVAAAVSAARAGARTLLLERYGFLGGAATNAQVLSYCGFFLRGETPEPAIGGVGTEILDRIARLGGERAPRRTHNGNWVVVFHPEAVKLALDEITTEPGLMVRLHSFVCGVWHQGRNISSVQVADHRGLHEFTARQFIDASGEGDLASLSRVPDLAFGQALQAASFTARIGGIRPGAELDPLALLKVVERVGPVHGVAKLRHNGGILYPLPGSDEHWWMGLDMLVNGSDSGDLTKAERDGRHMAWRFVQELRALPGYERAYVADTGPQLGVRETRRPGTRVVLTAADAVAGRPSETAIARAAWPIEVHSEAGRPSMIPIGGKGWFDVPMDALRAVQIDNLNVAGRLTGSDQQAYGSIRVMGTAFATGQAAGAAAVAALDAGGEPDYRSVRRLLESQGALV